MGTASQIAGRQHLRTVLAEVLTSADFLSDDHVDLQLLPEFRCEQGLPWSSAATCG